MHNAEHMLLEVCRYMFNIVMFADFCGVNTPIMVDFLLPSCHQLIKELLKILAIGF